MDSNQAFLVEYLSRHDTPCPSCAYNLRGLAGDRCPECNQHLTIRVGLVEPRMGVWLAAVIVQALGVGFSGLLLGFAVIMVLFYRGGPPPNEFVYFVLFPFLVQAPYFAVLLVFGRSIRRRSLAVRCLLLGLSTVFTIAGFLVFSLNVR